MYDDGCSHINVIMIYHDQNGRNLLKNLQIQRLIKHSQVSQQNLSMCQKVKKKENDIKHAVYTFFTQIGCIIKK